MQCTWCGCQCFNSRRWDLGIKSALLVGIIVSRPMGFNSRRWDLGIKRERLYCKMVSGRNMFQFP